MNKDSNASGHSMVVKECNTPWSICFSLSTTNILHSCGDFVLIITSLKGSLSMCFSWLKSISWSCSTEKVYPFDNVRVIFSEKDD